MNKTNVILYSYRRPELTERAIARVCNWSNLKNLYVSIDGLRSNASADERAWRSATISLAEKAAHIDSRIVPVIWDVNEGLTFHAIRIMNMVFESDYRLISLEEDNFIQDQGLDFLAKHTEPQGLPAIVTAFSSTSHLNSNRDHRFTYFPEQWATSLTCEVFDSFTKVWNDKLIDREIIQSQFKQIYPVNRIKQELIVERWFRIYNSAVNDFNYGDAVMSYAALRLGVPYVAPINSFVKDIGFEDSRGMNPRVSEIDAKNHKFKSASEKLPNVCIRCENSTNQLPGMGIKFVARYLHRRFI